MRKHAMIFAAMVAFAGTLTAPAQARTVVPAISAKPVTNDSMPERVLNFPEGVRASADVTYSTIVGYRPITLDLYRPRTKGPHPLVIYVHGGGWMIGNTRELGAFTNLPAVFAGLSAKGYVVASLEYRLGGEAPFPAAVNDVRTAIRFLKANAGRYGVDTRRVAIWGASAGAQLASLAALDCGHPPSGEDKSNPGESDCVQAAVTWYGLFDFSNAPQSAASRAKDIYLDCKNSVCDPRTVTAASPVTYVDAKDPPMLLIHGTQDKTVSMAQSQALADKLKAAKVPVTLELIPGAAHGWTGVDEAATRAASLRALDLTFRFLDAQLRPTR
ncbi:alpha/beta hydrolase [Sphingobium sp. JS3065]|uniref:alpha/beta hydrolase n=1 Tax=Sphingobium sp. JS3065 TaxID=2970925 RepID=UPI002263DEFD|nr:alpha/beta hydrolase [Sphingobium sp. JS3065]UZW57400.1 alpha/beta hydrolase [Sphingobium sp. JS3065]